jgi:RNA polymerase sigma-70 factor (ECF subfamily)
MTALIALLSSPQRSRCRVSDARRTDASRLWLCWSATLRGEAAAFELIVDERRVFSLAMKLLGSTDDAEDAAQEVFLRVFKYIHRFDVDKPIEPWLMQMTVNVCRNIGRNRLRRWNTFPAIADDDIAIAHESSDPHSGFSDEQERQMLWKALDTLPEKERLAVILRDIDGMKTSEVAEILKALRKRRSARKSAALECA